MVTDMTNFSKVRSSAFADAAGPALETGLHLGGGARDLCLQKLPLSTASAAYRALNGPLNRHSYSITTCLSF